MTRPADAPTPLPALDRRDFLKASRAALASAAFFTPRSTKGADGAPVVGTGEHSYACDHRWAKTPPHIRWFETHGVTVDKAGFVYITHRGGGSLPSSDASAQNTVVVFDPDGTFVRSFGKAYHGGGHGIDVREEGGQEFLYLACMMPVNLLVKTDLKGNVVWTKDRKDFAACHKYDDPNAKFTPTNVAFAPDGGFYVADGYGSNYVHVFDKDASYVRTFGGTGDAPGLFKTPHGLWFDNRPGRTPGLVVADRANGRLQTFDPAGAGPKVVDGVSFPAHFDIRGDVLLVPDLHARVTLMDRDDAVITHLGYDPSWTRTVLDGFKMRGTPEAWPDGKFIHPHDACFDADGNIYVTEWVKTGRIDKLRKV